MSARGYIIGLVIFISGCASTTEPQLQAFPREQTAFELCPQELRAQYPDIGRYDGPYFGFRRSPSLQELLEAWGNPDEKRISWRNLAAPVIFAIAGMDPVWIAIGSGLMLSFHPQSVYVWRKGHYLIENVVDHPLRDNYQPHMIYWRWYYQGQACSP